MSKKAGVKLPLLGTLAVAGITYWIWTGKFHHTQAQSMQVTGIVWAVSAFSVLAMSRGWIGFAAIVVIAAGIALILFYH